MHTITFYSYKGGVGRTLALANVAVYLSRFGQNVCIMDFDLEAPGLHYKFPKFVNTTDIRSGLVDYIYQFTDDKVIPESLESFSLPVIQRSKSQGGIRLIPAGNVLSSGYWQKLASINWHDLFYERNSEGVPFFLELKERIRKEFTPDFLLIDSRTGITEMSGVCTYLFPDQVVFLIINNQENIEGARQILRSTQRLERLPKQEPVKVVFALTRIPFPEEERESRQEKEIVEHIKKLLNEPVEDLESQLSVEDICILHSDRSLELTESLRMSQEGITEETPLSRDYLRLFSKIIPEQIVVTKLESILDKLTLDIWDDADKAQEELEQLVASYPHKRSLEKLIDFYFIRKEDKKKKLDLLHRLWEISGTFTPKVFDKYISLFLDSDYFSSYPKPDFNTEIVETYIDSNPDNRIEIERRLAEAYKAYNKHKLAIEYYTKLLKEVEDKESILDDILDIYIETKSYEEAMKMITKYPTLMETSGSLRLKVIEIMLESDRIDELRKLFDPATERLLAEESPRLYLRVMQTLGRAVDEKVDAWLDEALRGRVSGRRLYELGNVFYQLDRAREFDDRVRGKHPDAEEIILELRRRHRHYSP